MKCSKEIKGGEGRKRDGQRTGTGTGADDKGKWIRYSTEIYDVQRVKPIPIIICIYDRAEGRKKLEDSMERGSLIITFTEVPRSESSDAQEDEDVIEGKREDGMNVGQNQGPEGMEGLCTIQLLTTHIMSPLALRSCPNRSAARHTFTRAARPFRGNHLKALALVA